ncbi:MAG TPA: outer membrane protein assembly factor BamE [Gallionella sp.]|nr:outer membrane protein assembly factor BamE [Gallionella sp.]
MRIKLILVSVLLASCSSLSTPLLSPYKMDIRQGNFISPEMRDKLKLGMSRQQVRYVLGTPMVSDVFHENRWDYAYRLEQGGKLVEEQHLTAFFEGDNLVRVEDNGHVLEGLAAMVPDPVVEPVKEVAKADPGVAVQASVQAWAAAWSAKNVPDYLAAYTSDYAPKGMSRKKWEKLRLDRISRPKVIEVTLSDASVSLQDDDHATVSFIQNYRSDAYRDVVQKTLSLVRQEGRWLIAAEEVTKDKK